MLERISEEREMERIDELQFVKVNDFFEKILGDGWYWDMTGYIIGDSLNVKQCEGESKIL